MSYEPVIKWCNKNGFKFYPTSAKEGTNVNDAFEATAQLGYEFIKNDEKTNRKNGKIGLENSIEETKKAIKKCSC